MNIQPREPYVINWWIFSAFVFLVFILIVGASCTKLDSDMERAQVFEVIHSDGSSECVKLFKSQIIVKKDSVFVMRATAVPLGSGAQIISTGDFFAFQKVQSIKSPGQCKGLSFNKDTKEWMP